MRVVDLRNLFASCNDVLIEIADDRIYYAEEKQEEGHHNLFLLEYNRETQRERILTDFFLSNPALVQHYFSFPEEILIVMEGGESEAWILRVEKRTGKETSLAQISFVGSFAECIALDERHILFFTEENERHGGLFQEYKKLTGCTRVAYLFDLEDEQYYYVRDPRVCMAEASGVVPFEADGQKQVLVLQPYGDEEEKEKCYRNMRWLGDNINDNVWQCPLFDFIVSVKAGEERIPLELILSAGTSGLCRFEGMDADSLYFRAKYYPANDQRLCAVDKQTGKKQAVAQLNRQEGEPPCEFHIDAEHGRVYRVTEREDDVELAGVLHTCILTRFSRELGEFIACVEDRYLVARYILTDGKDSFEFYSIYDTQTGRQSSYECSCAVKGDTVVLY